MSALNLSLLRVELATAQARAEALKREIAALEQTEQASTSLPAGGPSAPPNADETLSLAEAAQFLGCSESWLYKNVGKEVPGFKPNRHWLFRKSELQAYLNTKRVNTTATAASN